MTQPNSRPTWTFQLIHLAARLAPARAVDPEARSGRYWAGFVLAISGCLGCVAAALVLVITFAVVISAPSGVWLVIIGLLAGAATITGASAVVFANLAATAAKREGLAVSRVPTASDHWVRVRDSNGRLTFLGWSVVAAAIATGVLALSGVCHH